MIHEHLSKQILLKKNEDRRITRGHPWIFSNEIREIRGTPEMGDVVEALSAGGLTIGVGFYNPHSLIALRLLSTHVQEIDELFLRSRLDAAVQLRRRLYPGGSAVRLVHGEADFLPGLIIDQFGDQISLQAVSFGMDMRLQTICDCLQDMLHPMAIIERNDTPLRTMEQLPLRKGVLTGTAGPVMIKENEIDYEVDLLEGQKTGFFLDQRENRRLAGQYSNGLRVLDCFCNDGGFALNAAHGGAETVLGIDSSEGAIQAATRNAQRNGLQQIQFVREDAFEALNRLAGEGRIFDMIILDPPSFSRNRKTVPAARHGYRDLHARAFRVLAPDGFLATACCSHHIDAETFLEDLQAVARKAGKRLQLLQWRGAPSDHPVLPGVPETEYLKFGLFKVSAP